MAQQNYTTYTETDPNSRYTVTSTKIDVVGLDRSEDAHVVYDFGAAAFPGDFYHKVDVYIDSASQVGGFLRMAWGLANAIDDVNGLRTAAENYLEVYLARGTSVATITLAEYYGSNVIDTSINLSFDTLYYTSIVRDEAVGTYGTLYCYIYSDSARTTLVDTLSITLRAAIDFRYCFGANSFNNTTTGFAFTGYVENLITGLGDTETVTIPKIDFNFTGKVPKVYNSVYDIDIAVGKVDFNFTGKVPTVSILSNVIVPVPAATFNFSRYAPTIRTTDVGIQPGTATFNFTGQVPTVSLTGHQIIAIPVTTFNFTGKVPSILLTNTEEEISWGLFDTSGNAITGATPTIKIRSRETGYILDWSDNTFKLAGGTTPSSNMTEMDASGFPGYYKSVITIGGWSDGWYIASTTYSAGSPKQNGSIEFLVKGGQMVDSYNSANLDMAVSAVNTNVLTRLPTSSFIAPDNAGIAAISTIVTLIRKHATNKMTEVDNGDGTKTFTIFDDPPNEGDAIFTYTYTVATTTRNKAVE